MNKQHNIYKITNVNFPNYVYIGSTCLPLNRRLCLHRSNKNTSACEIFDGSEQIELLCMCFNKEDAEDIETIMMNIFSKKEDTILLNKKCAGVIRRCGCVKKYKNTPIVCGVCGKTFTRANKSKHLKTDYHKKHVNETDEKIIVYFD